MTYPSINDMHGPLEATNEKQTPHDVVFAEFQKGLTVLLDDLSKKGFDATGIELSDPRPVKHKEIGNSLKIEGNLIFDQASSNLASFTLYVPLNLRDHACVIDIWQPILAPEAQSFTAPQVSQPSRWTPINPTTRSKFPDACAYIAGVLDIGSMNPKAYTSFHGGRIDLPLRPADAAGAQPQADGTTPK